MSFLQTPRRPRGSSCSASASSHTLPKMPRTPSDVRSLKTSEMVQFISQLQPQSHSSDLFQNNTAPCSPSTSTASSSLYRNQYQNVSLSKLSRRSLQRRLIHCLNVNRGQTPMPPKRSRNAINAKSKQKPKQKQKQKQKQSQHPCTPQADDTRRLCAKSQSLRFNLRRNHNDNDTTNMSINRRRPQSRSQSQSQSQFQCQQNNNNNNADMDRDTFFTPMSNKIPRNNHARKAQTAIAVHKQGIHRSKEHNRNRRHSRVVGNKNALRQRVVAKHKNQSGFTDTTAAATMDPSPQLSINGFGLEQKSIVTNTRKSHFHHHNTGHAVDHNQNPSKTESKNAFCFDRAKVEALLHAVEHGIPARYYLVALTQPVLNLSLETAFNRSQTTQRLFENCRRRFMALSLSRTLMKMDINVNKHETIVDNTDDDIDDEQTEAKTKTHYRSESQSQTQSKVIALSNDCISLSNHDFEEIEDNISEWIGSNGEYSIDTHANLSQTTMREWKKMNDTDTDTDTDTEEVAVQIRAGIEIETEEKIKTESENTYERSHSIDTECTYKSDSDVMQTDSDSDSDTNANMNANASMNANVIDVETKQNQNGREIIVIATNHIKKHTVLGRIIGDEMLESEFYQIYEGTFSQYQRQLHSWTMEVNNTEHHHNHTNTKLCSDNSDEDYDCDEYKDTEFDDGNDIRHSHGNRLNTNHGITDLSNGSNEALDEMCTVFIDCFGSKSKSTSTSVPDSHSDNEKSLLLSITDCRQNVYSAQLTPMDFQRENVLFVTVEINDWPGVFVIAKRDINRDEQICGYFGLNYGPLKKQTVMQQKSVANYVAVIKQQLFSALNYQSE